VPVKIKYDVVIPDLPQNKWSGGLLFPSRSSAERERKAAVKAGYAGVRINEVLLRG